MNLTLKDTSYIYRALGMIEGVAAAVGEEEAKALIAAVEIIDGVLKGN